MLAGVVLREQGIAVEWIAFETPFFGSDKAAAASRRTGIPLRVRDITEVYLEMLKDPPAGFGRNMNPCMDCHTLMFREAGETLRAEGFDFLFSGEVLGQRPMSQTRTSLRYVEKHSGLAGHILRPLSAKRLPETIAEQEGLVDRGRLYDLAGRSRKPQIAMAARFGISDYPAPAGGCLLTDPGYSRRLRDLMESGAALTRNALELLKHGRHFRLGEGVKIVVGRTRQDNREIQRRVDPSTDVVMHTVTVPGPVVAIPGGAGPDTVRRAAGICAGYSKAPSGSGVEVAVSGPDGRRTLTVLPVPPQSIRTLMV